MSRDDLRDRLYREMLDSRRSWTSEEIARAALKIVSGAVRAESLVGAILSADPRFRRERGGWLAVAAQAPALARLAYLLADAPRPRSAGQEVPIFFRPFDPSKGRAGPTLEVRPAGSGLERLAPLLRTRLIASLNAPRVQRHLHRLERDHGILSASEQVLDLRAGLILIGESTSGEKNGAESFVPEEALHACAQALERVLEGIGAWTLDRFELAAEAGRSGQQVDFDRFAFGPDLLEDVPARPGIYRFYGDERRLLYVGKSRDLRRRLAAYFRPLAPDHVRRAHLLSEIRTMEWETTPSEIEALVMESEAIRRDLPPHNQKVEVHPEETPVREDDRDLLFIACDGGAEEISVFFLRGGRAYARARMPSSSAGPGQDAARRLASAWLGARVDPDAGLVGIDEPEAILVHRHIRFFGDQVDRIRLQDFRTEEAIAAALLEIACRPREPESPPWLARQAAGRARIPR